MWSAVTPCETDVATPSARAKHSATLFAGHVYLLGGRNRNVPLKDFWKYHLASGKWYELHPSGDKLPCLQEHTAVAYKDSLYIFGGEVGFSADTETPLWRYDLKTNCWKKIRSRKGVSVPRGRRGHTALVHKGTMLIYGGYQDLRGSCSELWAFHFETESWHLISSAGVNGRCSNDLVPPARHKHSAVLHEDAMWVYGGMTDLQERADLWKWDIVTKTWSAYKLKHMPGPLHSHAACRLPSSMLVFGGERDGHPTNDVWKFHFDTELWEKLQINGLRPQPRAECVAFAVSELLLKDTAGVSYDTKMAETRTKITVSNEKSKHTYLAQRKVAPMEKTYVFRASQGNYTDGSDIAQQFSEPTEQVVNGNGGGFLKEISKLSQLNLSRLSHNKCSYSVLTTGNNDSTESLLRQHSNVQDTDSEHTTPTRMVKSKSAHAIKKKFNEPRLADVEETNIDSVTMRNTRLNAEFRMPREPISVPNFATITLPTPVLTPVEVARLVFLDSEDELDEDSGHVNATEVRPSSPKNYILYENFKSVKRGESYNSHLGYADNPLYQHMIMSNSVRFDKCPAVEETFDENGRTSDYASIETMNRLSSASNCSVPQQTAAEESNAALFKARGKVIEGPFGFCNPNYLGPDVQSILLEGKKAWAYETDKKHISKMLNTPDSVLEDALGRSTSGHMLFEESLEMQTVNCDTAREQQQNKCNLRFSSRKVSPKSLELEETFASKARSKCRASSASRVERQHKMTPDPHLQPFNPAPDVFVPLYIFVLGGKEQGQVTVFKRPISIWKLKLF